MLKFYPWLQLVGWEIDPKVKTLFIVLSLFNCLVTTGSQMVVKYFHIVTYCVTKRNSVIYS